MFDEIKTTEFIKKSKIIHGDKFDYSKVCYVTALIKVWIICKKCGYIFKQTPNAHLSGHGCHKCAGNKRLTTEDFIEKAKQIHRDKFDYSSVIYRGSKIKIIIKCNKCGNIFKQSPYKHLQGNGCPACADTRLTTKEFIKRAKEVHGDKYDYSEVDYKNSQTKIPIICPRHGIFWQTPNMHLLGSACKNCHIDSIRLSKEKFIDRSNIIHNNKYDYSKIDYENNYTKVSIICPSHGIFYQTPRHHLLGKGCPECAKWVARSKGEKELGKFIESIYQNKLIFNSRALIDGKELDIYLPNLKLAFEYNGEHWHTKKEKDFPGYHNIKRQACKDAGITLVEIWENDWRKSNNRTKQLVLNEIKKAESNQ